MIYQALLNKEKKVAVIGLGYVGLPIAYAFANHLSVIGFDTDKEKLKKIKTRHLLPVELDDFNPSKSDIQFSAKPKDLKEAHCFIIAVPTPIDKHKTPNISALLSASVSVGKALKKGDYVIYESTVYPGCTEEDCLPILEAESGLKAGEDFKFGYSPERINPGDRVRTLEKVIKVVSGSDDEALEEISRLYELIIKAGIFKASSIKVAEAAKVIENTQRDLNIALVNELALIFDKMQISTLEVLEAAGTKWNFLNFKPGLVGGHCIGVDPYYLAYKSKQLGYLPEVILSGRRINNEISSFIATKTVQFMLKAGKDLKQCKVLLMGLTFKEDVSDIRNTRIAEVKETLEDFSVKVEVVDPYAINSEVLKEYDFELTTEIGMNYDAVIVAVKHKQYLDLSIDYFKSISNSPPILIDVKGLYRKLKTSDCIYWTL